MATQAIKDILNTEIPRPVWVLRPTYKKPLPTDITLSRPGPAQTFDPTRGKFKKVAAGEQRVYGYDQGLLMEPFTRTNIVSRSYNLSAWTNQGVSITGTTSVFISPSSNNPDAYEVTGSPGDQIFTDVGTFSGGREVAYFLVEGVQNKVVIEAIETNNYNLVGKATYDFGSDSVNLVEGNDADVIKLGVGPNGGDLVRIGIRYNPTKPGDAADYSGNSAKLQFKPDKDGDGNAVTFHHAQLEDDFSFSSPIVTNGSQKTRDAETYGLSSEDWRNPKNETWIYEIKPLDKKTGQSSNNNLPAHGMAIGTGLGAPYTLRTYDGSAVERIKGVVNALEFNTLALSHDAQKYTLAANGQTFTKNTNHRLRNMSKLDLLNGNTSFLISSIKYIPSRLDESTLKTVTA